MRVELVKQEKTIPSHHHICIGGMFTIPSHGWFMTLWHCFTMFYPCDISMLVCYVIHGPGTVSSQRGPWCGKTAGSTSPKPSLAPRTRPHMVVSLKWGYRIRDTPIAGWLKNIPVEIWGVRVTSLDVGTFWLGTTPQQYRKQNPLILFSLQKPICLRYKKVRHRPNGFKNHQKKDLRIQKCFL